MVGEIKSHDGNIAGKQPKGSLGCILVVTSHQGQYRAGLAPLRQPVVASVGEVAIVGNLDVAQSSLGKLRFQVESAGLSRGPMEHDQGLPFPKGVTPTLKIGGKSPRSLARMQQGGQVAGELAQ